MADKETVSSLGRRTASTNSTRTLHPASVITKLLLLHAASVQARMRKDMARLEAQRQELSDRITSLQASIFKGSEKLDQVLSPTLELSSCHVGLRHAHAMTAMQLADSTRQPQGSESEVSDRPQASLGVQHNSLHGIHHICPAAVQAADELEPGGARPVGTGAAAEGGGQPGTQQVQVHMVLLLQRQTGTAADRP